MLRNMADSAKTHSTLPTEFCTKLENRGGKRSNEKGSRNRSHVAREQSNRAKESSKVHSRRLGISTKFANDAAENLAVGRQRQRKRDAAKLKPAARKKGIA